MTDELSELRDTLKRVDEWKQRMVSSYEKYANPGRVAVSSTTYDKIMALLAEMEEAGNVRAKQLRSEMSWTRRVTGAD